ncbi:MAG: hypothetical protein AB1540_04385, partial [Bdellovibrionota bacterium]
MKKNAVLLACAALLVQASPSWAFKFALVGAGSFSDPEHTRNEYEAKLGLGAGALLEAPLTSSLGVEFGALFLQRRYGLTTTDSRGRQRSSEILQKGIELPVTMNFWMGNIFS